ncbi:Alstrom syndrome protein 1 homolog [Nematolebias whitei]|uniref:Alstrom syndrome protein 1 homolog n=1 Tax=Nematolebias whitei TaxID=451745 RepID=UPI00189B7FA8|nr:Alstrom syndrome protein 1 homolog [Nematolebias whitei]
MTSSQRTNNNPSTQAVNTAPASVTYTTPQDSTVGGSEEMSLAISKSAGRTEPEGCSAAPPYNIPIQPQVKTLQQLNSDSSDRGGVSEEEECSAPPAAQSHSSSSVNEDADQEELSDGSSESSLAVRVSKLLQNESSATMMSSMPSTTDQEENKTKEWIKLYILGQQCELQELNIEDRKCIEEIKKELLLKKNIKSQGSTDTESSASFSLQVNKELNPPSGKTFSTLSDEDMLHCLSMEHPESNTHLKCIPHTHLEARVCEIAAREGVNLSRKQCQTFTSITISTRRRSTSSSPSTTPAPPLSPAPHPLYLSELSIGTGRPIITDQPVPPHLHEGEAVAVPQPTNGEPSVYEASKGFYNRRQSVMSQSALKKLWRQDTLGGQYEEFPPLKQGLDQTDVPATIRHDRAQLFSSYEEFCICPSSVLGVDHKPSQAACFGSTARPDYISHLHLKLSPKVTDHTPSSTAHSIPCDVASGLPQQLFVIPKDSSSAASSPDEGVGSSSAPECCDSREPVRQQAPERSDTFNLFKPVRQVTAVSTQSISQHKTEAVPGSPTAETSAPVLLPYKPHGSEELFYIPRTEADVSCTEQSETTMESTHTGSDDAVPPHFTRDVLGNKDPGLDRGVTLRHPEGIYSKRLKAASFEMQHPELRVGASAAADKGFPAVIHMHKPSSLGAITFAGEPSQNNHKISTRDQVTSPVQFLQYKSTEISHKSVHQVHVETVQTSVSQTRERDLSQLYPEQSSSTLDHRWQKFCSQWITEVSRPASDGEASLLKRLECLSRLIDHTNTDLQEDQGHLLEEQLGRILRQKEAHQEVRRSKRDAFTEVECKVRGGKAELPIQQRLQVEEAEENYGHASISSYSSSQSVHHSPADRDESETSLFVSGSMSTVDTARLMQAFGPHKVQHLKGSSSLRKLYSTIDKQQERDRHKDNLHDVIPSQTTATKEPVAPDSASTSSTCTVPLPHGPSRALTAKRAKRLINKSVQTGDPGIVRNETLRHTRDVGTTFPSPGEAFGQISSSNMGRGRSGHKSPPKPHSIHRQRKNKRSPSKPCPKGVSWFISADTLSSETKKENHPAESSAWFEPYSRVGPWRAPLRQKQVHEDRDKQSCFKDSPEPDPAPTTRTVFSDLTCVSLQESLEMHRPEFISRSQQRVRHLALQVEERRLQAVFNRDRDMLFNKPRRPPRLPKSAGTTLLKRAVPRKEMIQRSKQIYESLPEVQQRREEERRKAECQSYRLNARLYNKRITNRVLGRRAVWH